MTDGMSSTDPSSDELDPTEQRSIVRDRYDDIAGTDSSCCDDTEASSCCDDSDERHGDADEQSRLLGYSDEEIEAVEDGADLGLGCGNPNAIASLEPGDTVLDLGSGGGFDCFLAAREVGSDGRVIGVDMTPAMVEKARANVEKNETSNVEFRLGEIEHLPVPDASIDVIISNCVINLSPDKPRVFEEAFRVLRPGGRLAIADVVRTTQFPTDIRRDPSSVAGCVAGASSIDELESMLEKAGFTEIAIEPKAESEEFIREWDDDRDVSDYIVSATIEGMRPNA